MVAVIVKVTLEPTTGVGLSTVFVNDKLADAGRHVNNKVGDGLVTPHALVPLTE